jgi:hypothetical protein
MVDSSSIDNDDDKGQLRMKIATRSADHRQLTGSSIGATISDRRLSDPDPSTDRRIFDVPTTTARHNLLDLFRIDKHADNPSANRNLAFFKGGADCNLRM